METTLSGGRATVHGGYDLWELFEYGERVSCKNPYVFLHFLASGGTRRVEVTGVMDGCGVSFRVQGPIGDDGRPGLLEYQLTGTEASSFTPAEVEVLLGEVSRHELPERSGAAESVARALGLSRDTA